MIQLHFLFRFVISTGDMYNFHFIKNEKTMSVRDAGGTHYSIPLNSALRFGLLYNPDNNHKLAVMGYTFENVADIVESKHPPRIIRATKEYNSGNPKSSVAPEETLVIRKVGRMTMKRKCFIKVFSFLSSELTMAITYLLYSYSFERHRLVIYNFSDPCMLYNCTCVWQPHTCTIT